MASTALYLHNVARLTFGPVTRLATGDYSRELRITMSDGTRLTLNAFSELAPNLEPQDAPDPRELELVTPGLEYPDDDDSLPF